MDTKPIIIVPELPLSLYGIPYHEYNASCGEWLGINRNEIYYSSIKLLRELIIDMNNNKKE